MTRRRQSMIAVPSEHSEAVQLMNLVRMHESRHPELRWLFAVPNGGHRNKVAAGKLKAEGVRIGVPDYLLPVSARCGIVNWAGLAIELKRTKNSKTSAEQHEWLAHLDSEGWRVAICKGHAAAWAVICDYLSIRNCLERAV